MSFRYRYVASLVLAASAVSVVRADSCTGIDPVCPPPNYLVNDGGGTCPNKSRLPSVCLSAGAPPEPARLECVAETKGSTHCEAWPQGESLTYQWSPIGVTTQGLGDPHNPNVFLTCMPGAGKHRVTVDVYGPNGEHATSTQLALDCPP